MSVIGDLERAFATALYPLRVPIAIGVVALAAVLAWTAYRRGWLAAARRHPARAAAVVLPLLAVGIPLAWYLGSPLFIRTELREPAPVAVAPSERPGPSAVPSVAPSAAPSVAPSAAPSAAPSPAPTAAPARTGTFSGADDFHFGQGTAILLETSPGRHVLRLEDFSVRNGPDLFVYLSPDPGGYADDAVELGRLKATDGSFNYELAPGTDVTAARSVVIWCKQFAVLFAVAPLDES